MQHLLTHIENIEQKIQKLQDLYKESLQENKKLVEQNKALNKSLEKVSERRKQLEENYQQLLDTEKARQGDDLSAYKKSITKELTGYLKELDRCIELVSYS